MKFVIKPLLIVLSLVLFVSCQTERFNIEDAQRKSELFSVSSTIGEQQPFQIAESDQLENPLSARVEEANFIVFNRRSNEWKVGAREMTDLMETILSEATNGLSVADRVDLQFVTYLNLNSFLKKAPAGAERQEIAAINLTKLVKHANPIDWRALATLLIIAGDKLDNDQFITTRDYILEGAEASLVNPMKYVSAEDEFELIRRNARTALDLLDAGK